MILSYLLITPSLTNPLTSSYDKQSRSIFTVMSSVSIVSWNVNGLQSLLKRGTDGVVSTIARLRKEEKKSALAHLVAAESPDIVALQEIRCSDRFDHLPYLLSFPYIYTSYCTTRKGYSGVLVATKQNPIAVHYGFSQLFATMDASTIVPTDDGLTNEGRLIVLEYDKWFLLCVYTPNSGIKGLNRLKWRTQVWDDHFSRLIGVLNASRKELVIVGDLNVMGPLGEASSSRHEGGPSRSLDAFRIDVSQAGCTEEERANFGQLLKDHNLIDTFRHLYPERREYTWHFPTKGEVGRSAAVSPNKRCGYRLDYALASSSLVTNDRLIDSRVLSDYLGSDHKPIKVTIRMV